MTYTLLISLFKASDISVSNLSVYSKKQSLNQHKTLFGKLSGAAFEIYGFFVFTEKAKIAKELVFLGANRIN